MPTIRSRSSPSGGAKTEKQSADRTASSGNSHFGEKSRWTFLTNHSHVLILLSQDSSIVLREVASRIGITERAVQRIIAELEEAGVIKREKVGRQNHYRIRTRCSLRHPIEAHRNIGDLLGLIGNGVKSR